MSHSRLPQLRGRTELLTVEYDALCRLRLLRTAPRAYLMVDMDDMLETWAGGVTPPFTNEELMRRLERNRQTLLDIVGTELYARK